MLSTRLLSRSSRYFGSQNPLNSLVSSSSSLYVPSNKKENSSVAQFHRSARDENSLVVVGAALVGGSLAVHYVIQGYNSYQTKLKEIEEREKQRRINAANNESNHEEASTSKKPKSEAKENIFSNVLNSSFFSRNYYDGGFEDKMSRREAALILGVRESSDPDRIKASHRKILLLNHPDRGGSAFLAAKVNEAKDLLLKGK